MKFQRIHFNARFASVIVVQAALLILTAIYGMNRLQTMRADLARVTRVNQEEASLASALQDQLAGRMIALRNVVLASRNGDVSAAVRQLDITTRSYAALQLDLRELLDHAPSSSEDEHAAMDRISDTDNTALATIADIVLAARKHDYELGKNLIATQLAPIQARWDVEIEAMIQIQATQNSVAIEASERDTSQATWVISVLGGLALLANMVLAIRLRLGTAASSGHVGGGVMTISAQRYQLEGEMAPPLASVIKMGPGKAHDGEVPFCLRQ
jgi:methyl-accepting chemotaxis protein